MRQEQPSKRRRRPNGTLATLIILTLMLALALSACAGSGASAQPTPPPARLLDPTAGAPPVATVNPTAGAPPVATANLTAAAAAPTGRPAQLSGTIDDLTAGGWLVGGTLVVVDGSTRLTGAPERGAWVQVRGDEAADGRVLAREASVIAATALVLGPLQPAGGELWTIGGVEVRVPAAIMPAGLAPGRVVRAVVRRGDDDDDDGRYVALLLEPARTLTVTGQLGVVDAAGVTVDGWRFLLAPGAALPAGLAPGVVVRVGGDDDDDDGRYTLRTIERAPDLRLVGGTVQRISGNRVVVGGQELRLAPGVLLVGPGLVVGRPVQLIVELRNTIQTVVSVTVINLVVLAPQNLVAAPRPPAVVVRPPAPPRPPSSGSNNSSRDDDDDGGDDDDDDD